MKLGVFSMKKNKGKSLMASVNSMAAVGLVLAPFIAAGAGNIATGTSPGQSAAFDAMSTICGRSNQTFNDRPGVPATFACDVGPGAGAGVNNTAQNISPQAAMQAETISITSPYQFIRSVNQQAQKLRDCESAERQQDGTKKRKSECNGNWNSGGGSSSDAYGFMGPFGVSFSGGGSFGDQNTTAAQTGFKINTRQATLTIDYPFMRELIGGFAFNYVSADRTLDLASGKLNSDSYRFAPFLSYTPTPNSYVTLMGGYAHVDFDSTRSVSPFAGHILTDAKATYGANEYFASLGTGYTWRMDAWSLRGYGRGDYNHLNINGFQESGGQDLSVGGNGYAYTSKVNGSSVLSATSTLGAELTYAISTSTLAAVVIPKLHAEWVHEYKNDARQNQTTFLATNATTIIAAPTSLIAVAGSERNWANVGFGLQTLFPHAIVGYLNYDTLFIQNASNQTVSGGVRVNF